MLLSACAPPTAQLPTATPAPTATAAPTPTPTPAPTATPAAATGEIIQEAMEQSAAAATYRLNAQINGSGSFQGAQGGSGPQEVLAMEGAFAGEDYEYSLQGLLASLLAADPASGLEAVRVDGDTFVRGPLPLFNAPDAVWYRLPPEQAAFVAPPVSAATTLGQITAAGPDFSDFVAGGEELRDGLSCRRYTAGREATLRLLESLRETGLPGTTGNEQLDEASGAVVICEDGYLHGLELSFGGPSATDPDTPYRFTVELRLSDFDERITITAPRGAVALPSPTR